MAESRILVDLFNPGQVFACLGLVEIADVLLSNVEGGFDWSDFYSAQFCLRADGNKDPGESTLRFLKDAEITALEPPNWAVKGSKDEQKKKKWREKWDVERKEINNNIFPFPEPETPAILPIVLSASGVNIYIDHWGDDKTGRDKAKFWSGMGGYPGAMLAQDAQKLLPSDLKGIEIDNPFDFSAPQKNSFGFDRRRGYIPIDLGFSPNKHRNEIAIAGYPVVELLAMIGMIYARPLRKKELEYRYAVPMNKHKGQLFPPVFLRAALGSDETIFSGMLLRCFRMFLEKPGQEAVMRMITTVIEETDK